jgi:nucleoside-diphosphate-sugar epimerase
VIVDGSGLLGRAFNAAVATQAVGGDGYIFARGVADSSCRDPEPYTRERAHLDAALTQASADGRTFVYFSGAPIYGRFDGPVDEGTAIAPTTPYGIHQARAEDAIRAHSARHLIVRLPNVVGPGANEHQLMPALVRQANAGTVTVQDDAERDLIEADDVVRAVLAMLATGVADRTVVVASGISTPVRELASWVASDLGLAPRFVPQPGGARQRFRIDVLRSLAPGVADHGLDYPRRLVRRFVHGAARDGMARV